MFIVFRVLSWVIFIFFNNAYCASLIAKFITSTCVKIFILFVFCRNVFISMFDVVYIVVV